jgi:hypothetical protein
MKSKTWIWICLGVGVLVLAVTEGGAVISNIVSSAYSAAVNAFALAVQSAEGYYAGSWSYTTNNPGNITDLGRPGQVGTKTNPSSGITFPVFDTYESGFDALCWKINRAMNGQSSIYSPLMTISQFFQAYSGDQNEANNVAQSLGVDPATTLGQFQDAYNGGSQA